MKEDKIQERYERYAEHSQDKNFFENLEEDIKLSEADVSLLKEINDHLSGDDLVDLDDP